MTDKNTGGSAFPIQDAYLVSTKQGMTLRDYFAAKAMQGLLADSTNDMYIDDLVKLAYKYSDLMLKARDENNRQV